WRSDDTAHVPLPDDASYLCHPIAETEIPISVSMRLEIRHLAADPEWDERTLHYVARRLGQRRYRDGRRRGRTRKLVGDVQEIPGIWFATRLAHRRRWRCIRNRRRDRK